MQGSRKVVQMYMYLCVQKYYLWRYPSCPSVASHIINIVFYIQCVLFLLLLNLSFLKLLLIIGYHLKKQFCNIL